MNLQTILHPSKNICDVKELYYHTVMDMDLYDGYFNLFYIEKHKAYTFIDSLELVLRCRGYSILELMHDREVIKSAHIDSGRLNEGYSEIRCKFPYDEYDDGVFWFRLTRCSEDAVCEGYYEGHSANKCNPVVLGVNICTYKREKYVLRNMKSLVNWAENDRKAIASKHMHVFIIDNGRTLSEYDELQNVLRARNYIEIIPNDNTGGAGGFGRGMLEAMARKGELSLTHLIMMDDDAVFDPDLFTRLYGFLSFLKKEYAYISVGGALFREDYRYIQHASGEWFENFRIINEHPLVDMRLFENASAKWMTTTVNEHDRYGAWWCCCYPMEVICKENLPLPLFVHHDDIQFGMKLAPKNGVVFLNGVNVWHQGFELSFTGVKQYYNTRNELISMKMFYKDTSLWSVKYRLIRRIVGSLICMRYGDIELIHMALRDYMKGIGWLFSIDVQQLNALVSDTYKKIMPFKAIDDLNISEKHRKELIAVSGKYDAVITPNQLRTYYDHKKFESGIWRKLSLNGWLLPAHENTCFVTPLDSPWKPYRYRYVILYQPADGKCAVMKKDYRWLFKSISYCLEILFAFKF